MLEALLEATALPNLHPALVRFPIALAVAALLREGEGTVRVVAVRFAPSFGGSGDVVESLFFGEP